MSFDFTFTQDQLARMLPNNTYVSGWFSALNEVLPDYDVTSLNRVAAFISQCAHESNDFVELQEDLNYSAERLVEVWPRTFTTTAFAAAYSYQPEKLANLIYANRLGNGDEASGDGWKFRGCGLIQLTGRSNYQLFANSISSSIDDMPNYLLTFQGAVQGACWFWESHDLNSLADSEEISAITQKINGGEIGLEDRLAKYQAFKDIMS